MSLWKKIEQDKWVQNSTGKRSHFLAMCDMCVCGCVCTCVRPCSVIQCGKRTISEANFYIHFSLIHPVNTGFPRASHFVSPHWTSQFIQWHPGQNVQVMLTPASATAFLWCTFYPLHCYYVSSSATCSPWPNLSQKLPEILPSSAFINTTPCKFLLPFRARNDILKRIRITSQRCWRSPFQ